MTDLRGVPANDGGHGDAASYLLGALDATARERFELHAAGCAECQHDLAALQPVADELALAVPQIAPPAHLRLSVVAAARALADAAQAAQDPAQRLSFPPLAIAAPRQPIGTTPVVAIPAATQRRRRAWWQWAERASALVAAASLAVAMGAAGYAYAQRQEIQHTTQTAAQLSETLAVMYQPGMVAKTLSPGEAAPQARARLFLAPDGQQAVLMAYDLPQLARDKAYQLWLNNPDVNKKDSGGLFHVDEKGRGQLIVRAPAALEGYKTCGVTKEPAQGSRWPTGERVLVGQL